MTSLCWLYRLSFTTKKHLNALLVRPTQSLDASSAYQEMIAVEHFSSHHTMNVSKVLINVFYVPQVGICKMNLLLSTILVLTTRKSCLLCNCFPTPHPTECATFSLLEGQESLRRSKSIHCYRCIAIIQLEAEEVGKYEDGKSTRRVSMTTECLHSLSLAAQMVETSG